ncbi:MAG: PAS domain S-box protein [Firmicutes bacterium]|nr:PAS domain S-box protein [Bacillota bacterium]
MNSIIILPLLAFIICLVTWSYILAQHRKSPVNRAYLILSGVIGGWNIINLILWSPVHQGLRVIIMRFSPLFWVPTGFLFLNFVYVVINKRRDYLFFLVMFLTVIATILSVASEWIVYGYKMFWWGPGQENGPLYYLTSILVLVLPAAYALWLVYRGSKAAGNPVQKKQLQLILWGGFVALSVAFFTDVFLAFIFRVDYSLPSGSMACAILAIFVFLAVIRYRFLTVGIEDIAAALFANVQDGVVIVDDQQTILLMNQAAYQLFGLKKGEPFNAQVTHYLNDYDFEVSYKNHETTLRDNPKIFVSLSQSNVYNQNRQAGKLLIIRDITLQKQTMNDLHQHRHHLEELVAERTRELREINQKLRREIKERKLTELQLREQEQLLQNALAGLNESKEKYQALAENTFDLICEVSVEGNYLYLSPNYREVLGYKPEELLGQNIFQQIHPNDLLPVIGIFNSIAKTSGSGQFMFRFHHKNDDWLWLESTGKFYNSSTGELRGVFVSRDITARKKMEEEMIKANKLESIGLLAGGIAHDFNNILNIIWGNFTIAKTLAKPGSEVYKRLIMADKAFEKARELTQQLVALSKGGAPIKKTVSLVGLISESIHIALSNSEVQCEFIPDLNLWMVEADEGQLSQVFNNLLINAKQAMNNSGLIVIKAENTVISEEDDLPLAAGKYVKISLKDNGVGIPEKDLRKIFEPYFSTKTGSSGLGLTTVYYIIKKHNGHILVESQPGSGATFYLFLPAAKKVFAAKKDEPKFFQ